MQIGSFWGNYDVVICADHGFGTKEDMFKFRYEGVYRSEACWLAEKEVAKIVCFSDYENVWIADVRKEYRPSEPYWGDCV